MFEPKTLHFSVEGDFITRLAREKLYYNDDLFGAVELLLSCLKTDEISDAERLSIAIKILNGKMKITGTYPNPDYRIEICEPKDNKTIKSWLENFQKKLRDAENSRDMLLRQLCCISQTLSDSDKREINSEWKEFRNDDDTNKIFDDVEDYPTYPSIFQAMGFEEDPVADFFDRIHNGKDDDYGWLEPNGTFHAVEWGDHQDFAYHWLKEHDNYQNICTAAEGDILLAKGWILLHNPSLGTATVTRDTTKHMTKAQREYLFDYFSKRNRSDLASQYYEGD